MYISGFIVPVPEDKKEAYTAVASQMGPIFTDHGALECVEGWEDDVPDGESTDFRKAVKAEPGEKIVFSWIIWPDRAAYDKGHETVMQDERMQNLQEMPFDGKRMIFGSFNSIYTRGR